jgi:serine/threonine-protein kinase
VEQNNLLAGRYRLQRELGTGGMSIVWQGFDEILCREVAVKVLKPEFADDRELRVRILREAQSAASLSHPHIAGIFDYGETPTGSYVVMERVYGVPFADRLRDGPVAWTEAVSVCAEVASAMAVAHRHGVVHRDIKPANVMVTDAGVKVIDFGISAVVGEAETDERGQVLGTLSYMAPERLLGRLAGTAADVYSLGLMLYRAVAGGPPWPTASIAEALAIHTQPVTHLLRRPAGVPPAVIGVCRDCVQKDPALRSDHGRPRGDPGRPARPGRPYGHSVPGAGTDHPADRPHADGRAAAAAAVAAAAGRGGGRAVAALGQPPPARLLIPLGRPV